MSNTSNSPKRNALSVEVPIMILRFPDVQNSSDQMGVSKHGVYLQIAAIYINHY